jgi:hypothetical protein
VLKKLAALKAACQLELVVSQKRLSPSWLSAENWGRQPEEWCGPKKAVAQ